jgi:hypothetical protein
MGIPDTVNDQVAYAPRNIYATQNVLVDIDDDNRLDIYGDVYLNGTKITRSGFFVDVRDYGAKGGGVDDTAAIQAAINAAVLLEQNDGTLYPDRRPEVHLTPDTYYTVSTITLPSGVTLKGNGGELRGLGSGDLIVVNGSGCSIEDVLFQGRVGGIDTVTTAIHFLIGNIRLAIRRCVFNGFKGSAILLEGNASWIQDCFAQNCVTDAAALAVPTGALHLAVSANDTWVNNCEFTTSRTGGMSASGNAYAVVILCKAATFNGIVAELSDHGYYINGVHNKFSNCRADINRGHGWVFAGGDGELSTCTALSNGRELTNTYDGFNITAGAYRFSACDANVGSTLTAIKHRYGFNAPQSITVGCHFDSTCYSDQHATAPINVAIQGARVSCTDGPFISITAGSTTWDVQSYRWPHSCWNLLSSSPVNMTTLTNGVPGQRVTIRGDGFTTFVHNGGFTANSFRMKAGANITTIAHTMYEFIFSGSSTVWMEV